MTSQQCYSLRQEKARTIVAELKEWLVEEYPKLLPKSAIAVPRRDKAFQYLISRLEPITKYLENGRLEIDRAANRTNLVENTIRLVALGRKNYRGGGPLIRRKSQWC